MKIMFLNNRVKALVIGVSKYQDKFISDVPNIKQNIKQLKQLLQDTDITVSYNEKKSRILRKLYGLYLNAGSDDTVFIYYTGHGLVNPDDNEVYLAAADTSLEHMEHDGIALKAIYDMFVKIKSKRKVLILDACNSGKILDYANDGQLSKQNAYIITSASKNSPAYYPVDNPEVPTYFTGELIDILDKGIDGAGKNLSFDAIYDRLYKFSLQKRLPRPRMFSSGKFDFVRNNANTIVPSYGASNLQDKINVLLLYSALTFIKR